MSPRAFSNTAYSCAIENQDLFNLFYLYSTGMNSVNMILTLAVASAQAPGEDGKKFGERETEEFGERGDRVLLEPRLQLHE